MANPVIHFEVQADDVERAKKFYEQAFGWKIDTMMTKEKGDFMDYWGLATRKEGEPGINGGMYKRGEDKLYTYDCTLQVGDIDKAIEDVKKFGGTITKEKGEIPGVGWFAGCLDTEGNKFGIMQPTQWSPK